MDVVRFVDGPLEETAQVEREPAESEDQHQTEDGFGNLSTLRGDERDTDDINLVKCSITYKINLIFSLNVIYTLNYIIVEHS